MHLVQNAIEKEFVTIMAQHYRCYRLVLNPSKGKPSDVRDIISKKDDALQEILDIPGIRSLTINEARNLIGVEADEENYFDILSRAVNILGRVTDGAYSLAFSRHAYVRSAEMLDKDVKAAEENGSKLMIAYAQTEGYAPVTSKAQEAPDYQDYLARAGEDNDVHYNVKIDATRVLLGNAENTFITPVFNGSASLRDASGQLIENTTKSVRRKETVDDKYLDNLFDDVLALYHLDQLGGGVGPKDAKALGPLPRASKILLVVLGIAWVGIAAVAISDEMKKRKG